MRDATCRGSVNNVRGAGAQVKRVDHGAQAADGASHVKRGVVDGRHDQIACGVQRVSTHFFLPGADDHFVHATHIR